ncbi:MAG: tRNA preQ1(34) S-adenosylmethionine ribosyltransferase-isomerase QueA [Pseudomonadota bacterium]
MKLDDFDFELPDALIATRPANPRSSARLLVAERTKLTDAKVLDLTQWLRPGDRLVLNDTKVLPARLNGLRRRKSEAGVTSASLEVTLLDPTSDDQWRTLIKPLKKIREGETVEFGAGLTGELTRKENGCGVFRFNMVGAHFDRALTKAGAMPLPPYIAAKRPADEQDNRDYQSVFARRPGAVAAPTASLHFDQQLIADLKNMGVTFSFVTLHVGAGTFLPVKVNDITKHKMHAEWGEVGQKAVDEIKATKASGGRIVPVGTTALRLIESAAQGGELMPWTGETDIFIYPGFDFRITDALMTNFHLPKSTLMMLVSALMGQDRVRQIYQHAVREEYRFFSYGDASLLIP